jgi:hypothetical protein
LRRRILFKVNLEAISDNGPSFGTWREMSSTRVVKEFGIACKGDDACDDEDEIGSGNLNDTGKDDFDCLRHVERLEVPFLGRFMAVLFDEGLELRVGIWFRGTRGMGGQVARDVGKLPLIKRFAIN